MRGSSWSCGPATPVAHFGDLLSLACLSRRLVVQGLVVLIVVVEGGFGVVFMAEQQQPVRRKVALKVLKPGMDTRHVVARFEAERQALARILSARSLCEKHR